MSKLKRSHNCAELRESNVGEEVCLMAWVYKKREMSKRNFIILRDRYGITQVVCDEDKYPEIYEKSNNLRSEFVIAVKGTVLLRDENNINEDMKTGKIEIEANQIEIFSESETPPFQIDDEGVSYDQRLKYRYIDLRRPKMQENIVLRHKITMSMRNFLNNEGFLDIETPMLTKSTPEGARDYLVPSRLHHGSFYALPQSPQQFKQLLMLSAMDKYYQIVRCFRDEDLRAERQPEFTQLDIELSFVDEEDIMELNERLIKQIFKDVLDVDIKLPLKQIKYNDAMEIYGSDKPDIRFDMHLVDIAEEVKDSDFVVFKNAIESKGRVLAINAEGFGDLSRKNIDKLVDFVKTYKAKGLVWMIVEEDDKIRSSVSKFFTEDELRAIANKMQAKANDLILIVADKESVAQDSLGNLRVHLAQSRNLVSKNDYNLIWITEFPLLEFNEEENKYNAKHHPFTAANEDDLYLLDSEPEKVRARAYDMVLNGFELGGGSIRIHDSKMQEKMFEILGHSQEDIEEKFGFLINAFKYGVPPHGGIAFGLDRIAMLMTGSDSLRDVIAFPKVQNASCPLTNAPSHVDEEQLLELGLKIIEEE